VLWSEPRGKISDMHFPSGMEAHLLGIKSYATSSRYNYRGKRALLQKTTTESSDP
jgi:hypothetical protein